METRSINSSVSLSDPCVRYDSITGIFNKIPMHQLPYTLAREHHFTSASDRLAIQSIISSCHTFLRAAQAERCMLEFHISNPQTYEDIHHSLLSPMQQVPDDILYDIFSYVVEETIDIGAVDGQIWILRNVNFHWRKVVDGNPLFWNRFKIGYEPEVGGALINCRIRACLENSGETPLTLSLLDKRKWPKVSYESLRDIAREADRWVSLETTTYLLTDVEIQKSIRNRPLARLRKLTLRGLWHAGFADYDIFRDATLIENLEFDYVYFPAVLGIPMNNVRKLSIAHCRLKRLEDKPDSLYSRLRTLSSLEELTWRCNDFSRRTPTEVIMLPSLHTLAFGHTSYANPDREIWDMLCAPSLNHLKLDFLSSSVGPILSVASRSKSVIRRLDISSRSSAVVPIMEEFRDVQELSLSVLDDASHTFIPKLIWDPTDGEISEDAQILPSLKRLTLTIKIAKFPESIVKPLADVLRSRSSTYMATLEKHRFNTALPSHLVHFKCITKALEPCFKETRSALLCLRQVGRECGIEVVTEIEAIRNIDL
ncbi:hypothetical protein BDQ17DRAFT_1545673 [Cyathus striatus]|nr:hypothetical protein BDQ17DRAFT_1545673 [Cyathus striatus]